MAYAGKSRAISYSDYYKNNDQTPGSFDDEENTMQQTSKPNYGASMSKEEMRKAALRRRLLKMRKAGS